MQFVQEAGRFQKTASISSFRERKARLYWLTLAMMSEQNGEGNYCKIAHKSKFANIQI